MTVWVVTHILLQDFYGCEISRYFRCFSSNPLIGELIFRAKPLFHLSEHRSRAIWMWEKKFQRFFCYFHVSLLSGWFPVFQTRMSATKQAWVQSQQKMTNLLSTKWLLGFCCCQICSLSLFFSFKSIQSDLFILPSVHASVKAQLQAWLFVLSCFNIFRIILTFLIENVENLKLFLRMWGKWKKWNFKY